MSEASVVKAFGWEGVLIYPRDVQVSRHALICVRVRTSCQHTRVVVKIGWHHVKSCEVPCGCAAPGLKSRFFVSPCADSFVEIFRAFLYL